MTDSEIAEMHAVTMRGVGDAPLPKNYIAAKAELQGFIRAERRAKWSTPAEELAFYRKVAAESESLIRMAQTVRVRAIDGCTKLLRELRAAESGKVRSEGLAALEWMRARS